MPTAITRRRARARHAAAVAAGTRKRSGYGGSPRSSDETPVCSTIGATLTPRSRERVEHAAVNGRPALGISALPGSVAKTVW